jgi:hypothetical protein
VTGFNFQFAARRLRVFERGVFHFGFAIVLLLLRMLAAALAVSLEAAVRAESRATVVAQEYDRKRRVDNLSHEVRQVEFVARQDVALTERIFTIAVRIEYFIKFELKR